MEFVRERKTNDRQLPTNRIDKFSEVDSPALETIEIQSICLLLPDGLPNANERVLSEQSLEQAVQCV